jgi:hypothetical protein
MKRIHVIGVIATVWLGALRVEAGDGSSGDARVAQLEAKVDRAIATIAALDTRLAALERRTSSFPPVPRPAPGTAPAPTPPPPAGMTEPSNPEPREVTVYVTRTGTKYHRAGCSYLKSSIPMLLSKAKAEGYTPCSRCNPP